MVGRIPISATLLMLDMTYVRRVSTRAGLQSPAEAGLKPAQTEVCPTHGSESSVYSCFYVANPWARVAVVPCYPDFLCN